MIKINFTTEKDAKNHKLFPVFESDLKDGSFQKLTKFDNIPDFRAEPGEIYYVLNPKTGIKSILVGLGDKRKNENITQLIRKAIHVNRKLPGKIEVELKNLTEVIAEKVSIGAILGTYNLSNLKQPDKKKDINAIVLPLDVKKDKDRIKKINAISRSMMNVMDLVNKPSNIKSPYHIADCIEESGKKFGYSVKAFRGEEVLRENLHALYAVGKGSKNPPAFVIMEHKPASTNGPTIGLVGKGISFDTGGISIKPSTNMHFMKSDMSGAAVVMGTLEVASQLNLPLHLVGIIPTAENAVDGNSYRPGDIIQSYSGKSIEVIDTDAEGRLILADGLAYMVKNYKPDYLIDLATLTGSCVATLGYFAAGLFTSNDSLANELESTGQQQFERLWRLPLWDDYKAYMNSDMADIKNLSSVPVAGATTAAKFLEFFTNDHKAWAHLDIAGVSLAENDLFKSRTATAFGVRLLSNWLLSLCR